MKSAFLVKTGQNNLLHHCGMQSPFMPMPDSIEEKLLMYGLGVSTSISEGYIFCTHFCNHMMHLYNAHLKYRVILSQMDLQCNTPILKIDMTTSHAYYVEALMHCIATNCLLSRIVYLMWTWSQYNSFVKMSMLFEHAMCRGSIFKHGMS